jgi:hypothetical protein
VYPQGKQSQRPDPISVSSFRRTYNRRASTNISNKKWTTAKKHTPAQWATQEKSAKNGDAASTAIDEVLVEIS